MKDKYKKVKVKRSFSGLGLYADEDIKKGEQIIEYTGPIIDDDEAKKLGGRYLFELGKNKNINGSVRSNTARYINHSCQPNCEPVNYDDQKIIIEAIRNIKSGEELLYDYGENYFDGFIKPNGCRCSACKT